MSYHPSIAETLAEELIVVRAQQARLKAREAEVRAALLLVAGPGRVVAPSAVVQIETRMTRRFDARRLPDHMRRDPQYQAEKETTFVRVLSVPPAARDDFEVIERF